MKRLSFHHCVFGAYVKNQQLWFLTQATSVRFQVFCVVPLLYVFACQYQPILITTALWQRSEMLPDLVLLFKLLWLLGDRGGRQARPCKFQGHVVQLRENCYWCLYNYCTESVNCFGKFQSVNMGGLSTISVLSPTCLLSIFEIFVVGPSTWLVQCFVLLLVLCWFCSYSKWCWGSLIFLE